MPNCQSHGAKTDRLLFVALGDGHGKSLSDDHPPHEPHDILVRTALPPHEPHVILVRRNLPANEPHDIVVPTILPHPSPLPLGASLRAEATAAMEGESSSDNLKWRTIMAVQGFNAGFFRGNLTRRRFTMARQAPALVIGHSKPASEMTMPAHKTGHGVVRMRGIRTVDTRINWSELTLAATQERENCRQMA